MNPSTKPLLNPRGKVYYITQAFPPIIVGSSVVNSKLLSLFDPASFVVYTVAHSLAKVADDNFFNVRRVFWSFEKLSKKLHYYLLEGQIYFAIKRIKKDAKKDKPIAIIGTYPDYAFLKIAIKIAEELDVPFYAYLHDTIVEGLHGSNLEDRARQLQAKLFKMARVLFVMSEGMKQIFETKYALKNVVVLPHIYSDKVNYNTSLPVMYRSFFWAGDIYGINDIALARLSHYIMGKEGELTITTQKSNAALSSIGLADVHINKTFFKNKDDYLMAMQTSDVLILALNWPDETIVHEDEIGTIFPTKTPEYLASGRPIIVHCPKHYFLHRFFAQWDCGILIDTRELGAIDRILNNVLNNTSRLKTLNSNALTALKYFNSDVIRDILSRELTRGEYA